MSRFLLALWLLSMGFLMGCKDPIAFAEPISPPGEVAYNTRLVGVWIARFDTSLESSLQRAQPTPVNRDIIAFNIWPDSNRPNVLRVDELRIPISIDQEIERRSGDLFPSAIDGRIYYNLHWDTPANENLAGVTERANGYIILRLDIVGNDSLLVQGMRYDGIKSLIAEYRITDEEIPRGSVLPQFWWSSNLRARWLSQGGEKLAALLHDTPGDRLFVDLAVFHRLDVKQSGLLLWQGIDSWLSPD